MTLYTFIYFHGLILVLFSVNVLLKYIWFYHMEYDRQCSFLDMPAYHRDAQ